MQRVIERLNLVKIQLNDLIKEMESKSKNINGIIENQPEHHVNSRIYVSDLLDCEAIIEDSKKEIIDIDEVLLILISLVNKKNDSGLRNHTSQVISKSV